jgi:dTDP-4-amino-4,6-dideoxygalactose transaminase
MSPKPFDPLRLDGALLDSHADRLKKAAGPRASARLAEKLAAFTGRRYCLLTASGRAAIGAGLAALGAGKGARVGMTDVTHPSALDETLAAGARPEFLDINISNLNMDAAALKARAAKLDALIFTPMFSASAPEALVRKLARANNFPILEDASQVIGVSSAGRPRGSFGDVSVFSLSSYKPVSFPGEKCGALLCDDASLFKKASEAAAPFFPSPEAAALMELKLSQVKKTLAGLRRNNACYRRELAGIKDLYLPETGEEAQDFPVLTARKKELEKFLLKLKVPLGRTYEPLHKLAGARGVFPGAGRYALQALHLPSYPAMTESECLYAAKAVKGFFNRP